MIRSYKESDFDKIEAIYDLSKKDEFSYEDFEVTVTPLSKDSEMLELFQKSKIYVYDSNGIKGFVGVKDNYISWLFVAPNFRKQQIGKKLVTYVLSKLNGNVTLSVARSNTPAINLYKNLGFKVTKEFVGQYQGNPILVCKMSYVKNG